jgi:hypothetical protein
MLLLRMKMKVGLLTLWLCASSLSVCAQGISANLEGRLCGPSQSDVTTSDEYGKLLADIRTFLQISSWQTTLPTGCVLEFPKIQITRLQNYSPVYEEDGYVKDDFILELVWGYALHIAKLDKHGVDTSAFRQLYSGALRSLYPDDDSEQKCINEQLSLAFSYIDAAAGRTSSDLLPLLQDTVSLRAIGFGRFVPCEMIYAGGTSSPPTPRGRALIWARSYQLEDLAARSISDDEVLNKLFNYLGEFSYYDDTVIKSFYRSILQKAPLFLPGKAVLNAQESPIQTRMHLKGTLSANNQISVVDIDLGSETHSHQEQANWRDPQYGDVWSSSQVSLSGGPVPGLMPGQWAAGWTIVSWVQGGYDPPYPNKQFPIRPATNHRSSLNFLFSARTDIPACLLLDASCEPHVTILAGGTDFSVRVTQEGANLVSSGPDAEWAAKYEANLLNGPLAVEFSIARDASHEGALDVPFAQRQHGELFIQRTSPGELNAAFPELWFKYLAEGGEDPQDLLYDALVKPVGFQKELSLYKDYFRRLFAAHMILVTDRGRLKPGNREAVEKASLVLSTIIRDRFLDSTKQRINDLVSAASIVDPTPIDLAIESLLEATADQRADALSKLAAFASDAEDRLTREETKAIKQALSLPSDASDETLTIEAILKLIEVKDALSLGREAVRQEIGGLVIELARMQSDCATVLNYYSNLLGEKVSLPGAFQCP